MFQIDSKLAVSIVDRTGGIALERRARRGNRQLTRHHLKVWPDIRAEEMSFESVETRKLSMNVNQNFICLSHFSQLMSNEDLKKAYFFYTFMKNMSNFSPFDSSKETFGKQSPIE